MSERNYVIYNGQEFDLCGDVVQLGMSAPDFELLAFNRGDTDSDRITRNDLLALAFPTLISVIASVDTPVGKIQVKTFNERLQSYTAHAVLISVSSDLPFTLNRFFDEEKIGNLSGCSDYQHKSFGKNWGVLITGPEILARAVFVLDKNGIIQYVEVLKDITREPNYDAAIAVLDRLVTEAVVGSS